MLKIIPSLLLITNTEDTLRWQNFPACGDIPVGRYGHSAVILGNEVFVFGGCDNEGNELNDLYALNLSNNYHWRRVSYLQPIGFPSGFAQHSAVVVNHGSKPQMYIVCGTDAHKKQTNKIWVYNFRTNQWAISVASHIILPRFGQDCFMIDDKHLCVLGGVTEMGSVDNISLLNMETIQWHTDSVPVAQWCRGVSLQKGTIYTCGGIAQNSPPPHPPPSFIAIFNKISDDVILNILKFLFVNDLCAISAVSKNWNVSNLSKRNVELR